ncbi:MAG: Maf family nucleotide pyrophosphatase [Bifidobacteriaceae bacterium]|jgi:septum formation protein|nr:Maf family nucleotide pyrophosphatase [Bifidobacteriaceae bacterium]
MPLPPFEFTPPMPHAPSRGRVTLVLASASPARRETLISAGIDPVQIVSSVDEDKILSDLLAENPLAPPADQVLALARAKARQVADQICPGDGGSGGGGGSGDLGRCVDVVLGCDSMLELDGEVLGKPRDAADAAARIRQQSGRSAVLHTGHWLVARGASSDGEGLTTAGSVREVGAASSTVVRFGVLSEEEIAAYVGTGEPLHVAGAFTIDGLGGPFIEGLDGDHHGVVGLSLPTLRHLLAEIGLTVMHLWRPMPPDPPG